MRSLLSIAGEKPLSPARLELRKAQARRAEAQDAFEAVSKMHARVERLIDGQKAIIDTKIAELEKQYEEIYSQWALRQASQATSQDGEPELPHLDEIEALKKQSRQAEMKEKSARDALSKINEQFTLAQEYSQQAIHAVRGAANQVLLEIAGDMVEELQKNERRSAALRGYLGALSRFLILQGHRRLPGAELSNTVVQMIPRGPFLLTDAGINDAVQRWHSLADEMMRDEKATMELPA
jgi:hypothetical protein